MNIIQINGGITINVNVSVKNIMYVKKSCIWNPATCSCENGKYLASIMDNSAITCNEIVEEEIKTVTTNFNERKEFIKQKTLLAFLLIRIALLIAVSIYCYLVKYKAKQKHL